MADIVLVPTFASMRMTLRHRTTSWMLATSLAIVPALGCSNSSPSAPPPPPVDDTTARRAPEPPAAEPARAGMSTGKKLVILGGAAALYYLYKHHQAAKAADGAEGQYYLSKNGRVYYRDADHRAHWVTPPPEGISVPEDEAQQYHEYQGYDNRSTGRDLTNLAEATPDPS